MLLPKDGHSRLDQKSENPTSAAAFQVLATEGYKEKGFSSFGNFGFLLLLALFLLALLLLVTTDSSYFATPWRVWIDGIEPC